MNKTNTTAWALLMVSDHSQADALADQEAWAQTTAANEGWTITETFSGVSGGNNPGLTMRMLERLEETSVNQRPARILTIRLDRLGRDGTEAVETFLRLREHGVLVHTRLDGDVTFGRASDMIGPVLRLLITGMESEIRQDKRRAAKWRHQGMNEQA